MNSMGPFVARQPDIIRSPDSAWLMHKTDKGEMVEGIYMQDFMDQFYLNFIKDNRWKYLTDGLKTTLLITFFAVILGLVLGFLVAIVRSSAVKSGIKKPAKIKEKGVYIRKLLGYYLFKLVDFICQLYLTVIRGTPTMIQLLIMYYVIFGSVSIDKRVVAILAFGINSGAYVAEIVRSGIMAIDIGQFEAGRSLGFGYPATMWHIILPQALKNVLPALGNEIIVLLKETSISGYIALTDLTHGGDVISSQTYSAFMPLIAVALIYLAIVSLLAAGVSRLERRLRTNER